MEFCGDYHLHTVYSDGRGTIAEMAEAALARGLWEVGICDHGPRNIGMGIKSEKNYLSAKAEAADLRERFAPLQILTGAEANIISPDGKLDLSSGVIEKLDYLAAGLHPYVVPGSRGGAGWVIANLAAATGWKVFGRRAVTANTKALIEAVHNYEVAFITHPGLKMGIDIPEVARACLARDTAWEINTGHRFPGYEDVREAARYGVDFIVNSDAHFPESVGCLDYGSWVLEKASVEASRVKNTRPCRAVRREG